VNLTLTIFCGQTTEGIYQDTNLVIFASQSLPTILFIYQNACADRVEAGGGCPARY
jgi:hypothetical protein